MFRETHKRRRSYLRVGSSSDENQDDTNQYRCLVCGFICDRDRVEVAGPRPNASAELTGIDILEDDDGDKYPSVSSGCPGCGTKYSR